MDDAHTQTLHWLLKPRPLGPGLREWLKGDEEIYWIQGKPGSGKSTAMKYLFGTSETLALLEGRDTNCRGSWVVIGSFFHDRGNQLQRSLDGILHSMLWQILKNFPCLVHVTLNVKDFQAPQAISDTGRNMVQYLWTTASLKKSTILGSQAEIVKKSVLYR